MNHNGESSNLPVDAKYEPLSFLQVPGHMHHGASSERIESFVALCMHRASCKDLEKLTQLSGNNAAQALWLHNNATNIYEWDVVTH